MKKSLNTAIILALSTIMFVGCATTEPVINKEQDTKSKTEQLVINLDGGEDHGVMTPYAHYSRGPAFYKMQLIFDSLYERGEKGMIPWLAKQYSVSEDGLKYIFELQEGVKWHDGIAMTSEDVVFTVNYYKEHPPLTNHLLINGKPFIQNVVAVDEHTVEIEVDRPLSTMLDYIGSARILPKHIWENVEEPEKFTEEKALVGCGPYQLTKYDKEQGVYQFKAFAEYWGPKPMVDTLQFVPVPNNNSILSFENGEIDFTQITPDVLDRFKEREDVRIAQNLTFWGYRLFMNMEKRPELKDAQLRRAMIQGIDKNELVEKVARGAGVAGEEGYLPNNHIWYNPDVVQYEYNPEKAQALLEGKTYHFKLLTGNSNAELRIAELLKISLSKIGIELEVSSMDTKSRDAAVKSGEYELVIYGSGGLGNDADLLRTAFSKKDIDGSVLKKGGIPGYQNDVLDQLAIEQLFERDEVKRKDLIFKMQEVIAEEVPIISLYNTAAYVCYRPSKYEGWKYMYNHHEMTHGKISYLDMDGYNE